jgi:ADP-ribose diphosphatase
MPVNVTRMYLFHRHSPAASVCVLKLLANVLLDVGFPTDRVPSSTSPRSCAVVPPIFRLGQRAFSASLHSGEMRIISSKTLLKNKLFTITEERAVDPDGFEIHRSIVRHPGSAVMMPVDERGRVLLVQQYRLPAKRKLWELPAGRLDPGEGPLKAAKRELREETGLTAKQWIKLGEFYPSPGYVGERMTLFLALKLTEGKQEPMEDERIEMRWFGGKELRDSIFDGQISDGKTMVGYFLWRRWAKSNNR